MQNPEANKLFIKGIKAFNSGHILSALAYFEKADRIEKDPLTTSYLAFCIAKERGQVKNAVTLCKEAIQKDPENPIHYLNLGKVYLHYGDKEAAISVFREGMKHETHQLIVDELITLGKRKPPTIPFLSRGNPVNKYLGIILNKLKIR